MKKNLSMLGLLAAMLMVCGCANDDNPPADTLKYITISTDIADRTRVKQDPNTSLDIFVENDKVSVYAWTGSKDVAPDAPARVVNNSVNTLNASGEWVSSPPMLWRNDTDRHYFVAMYPHHDTPIENLASVPIAMVPTSTASDMYKNDFLVARRTDGVVASDNPVEMEFKHLMGKVCITLSYRNQWAGLPTVEKVTLGNVAQSATYNYLTGECTPSADRSDLRMLETGENWQYTSVLIPQDGVNTITVTIDGHNYTYIHPTDINIKGGAMTDIRLTVGRDVATLGGMTIGTWGYGGGFTGSATGENPVRYVTDPDKLNMLFSLADMETTKEGRIYSMDYTADYKLDEALASGATDVNGLFGFVARSLYDVRGQQSAGQMSFGAGCSAFAATESSTSSYIMGRNYDFYHRGKDGKEAEIAAIVVHTAPQDGYRSVSVVDGFWLGMNRGFHTDGRTDLSMLMAAPYAFMDGINEKGFAIGVLHLDGKPTAQSESGKTNVQMNIAMRMLLDRAADVKEAATLLRQYNMHMASPAGGSFHFFMADANGRYATVEYVSPTGDIAETPWKIDVLDDDNTYRCATNFYLSPDMKDSDYGINKSNHGKERYDKMRQKLDGCSYVLSASDARQLLEDVSQEATGKPTSHTQWSSLYDLTNKSLKLWLLREFGKTPMEIKVK